MSKIIGIEVSELQSAVNWTVVRKNASYVYIKSSQGTQVVNEQLDEFWLGAGEVGLPRGLLHVFDPKDMKDWQEQLELFASLHTKYTGELKPALDIQMNNGLRKVEMDNIGAKMVKRFEEKTGVELVLRTNAVFFDKKLPLTNWGKHRMLWVVDIGKNEPAVPTEWSKQKPTWVFWNYSAGENELGAQFGLSSRSAHISRFFGVEARFQQIFKTAVNAVEKPKVDAPVPGEVGLEMRSMASSLIIRSGPGEQFPLVGELRKGDAVDVMDIAAEGDVWVQIGPDKWVPWKMNGQQKLGKKA